MIVRIPYRIVDCDGDSHTFAQFRIDSEDPEQVNRIVSTALYYALKVSANEEGLQVEQVP